MRKKKCPRPGHGSRRGKTARLPREIRDELNQRLLDGEWDGGLVKWTKVDLQAQRSKNPSQPAKAMQDMQKMGEKIALNRTCSRLIRFNRTILEHFFICPVQAIAL
ncbi:MAG: hypothetical protein ABSA83_02425 [Verrucomicrobiota bacterium]